MMQHNVISPCIDQKCTMKILETYFHMPYYQDYRLKLIPLKEVITYGAMVKFIIQPFYHKQVYLFSY